MAKKTEDKLSYLQMPLPSGERSHRLVKVSWHGLNMRQTLDTGLLSMEKNISTAEAPYLTPSREPETVLSGYAHPISIAGFDDFLVVVYRKDSTVYVDYITADGDVYTGTLKTGATTEEDSIPRCIVQFNAYKMSKDIVNGEYIKKLLIFPDKKSMYFDADTLLNDEGNDTEDDFALYDTDVLIKEYTNKTAPYLPPDSADKNCYYRNTHSCADTEYGAAIYKYCVYETENKDGEKDGGTARGWKISVPPVFPDIKYATVHLSRLFGVSDDCVYASGFNDYANWNLDTAGEYNESNAWCSQAQSNTKADGTFTGITTFQNHVVCFKRDFMHEIYNTKNPFRVQDIYAEGAIDQRTIQDVDGQLIFASADGIKVYTGADPRLISYALDLEKITYAVSGTDDRNYFLYVEEGKSPGRLFTYDTVVGEWSEQSAGAKVLGFAHNKNGMYALTTTGRVLKMDTDVFASDWCFETDFFTNKSIDIRHIRKIHMLADVARGAKLQIYILYDGEAFSEDAHLVYTSEGHGQKAIRVRPRKTAGYGFKIHVRGEGFVRVYQMEIQMNHGGELYVTSESD